VLRLLKEAGSSSVEELAAATGVVPVTMRSHLKALERQGLVCSEPTRGHVGRPRYRFRLTDKAAERLPNRCPSFAAELLHGLRSLAGQRGVDQLLDLAAARHTASHGSSDPSLEARVETAARALEEESGDAGWSYTAGVYRIEDRHCPYWPLAREDESVCRYHAQVVSRIAGRRVNHEQSIARGQPACVFAISERPASPVDVRTLSDGRVGPGANRP